MSCSDMLEFDNMNLVYREFFLPTPRADRVGGLKVEIECIALA
jgi:hypothetical protein